MAEDEELAAIRARVLEELQRQARAPPAPAAPVALTDAIFEAFVRAHPRAVVDCWAAWCGPCRLMEPVVGALAGELAGRVAFGKLDVDAHPATAARFDVASIPTFLVFRGGRLVDRVVGVVPGPALRARALA